MGKCRLWVNVAMGICRMGICRMGICRLTLCRIICPYIKTMRHSSVPENTYSRKHRCQEAKETLKEGDAERHYAEEGDVGSDEDGDNCPKSTTHNKTPVSYKVQLFNQ